MTNDDALAGRLRRLRNGGQSGRYRHEEFGVNSRLDELQAAVLQSRLARLPAWTTRRRELAATYRTRLAGSAVRVPPVCDPGHVYHLFPVRTRQRAEFMAHLTAHGVGTLIHYPVAIPRQPAFASLAPASCPIADEVCDDVVSLPLHPHLTDEDATLVVEAVLAWRPAATTAHPGGEP